MSAITAELVGSGQPGIVYLLHFDEPYRHARHYLGWARAHRLHARLASHGKANGSALMRAVADAGIGWQLARTWPGDRHLERRRPGRARLACACQAGGVMTSTTKPCAKPPRQPTSEVSRDPDRMDRRSLHQAEGDARPRSRTQRGV